MTDDYPAHSARDEAASGHVIEFSNHIQEAVWKR